MKAILKFVAKVVDKIATIRTTIFKEGGTYMVKDEVVIFGMVVATDTRKAAEAVK